MDIETEDKKPDRMELIRRRYIPNAICHPLDVAAAVIGISLSSAYKKVAAGEIEARKIGHLTVIEDEVLRKHVKAQPKFSPGKPVAPRARTAREAAGGNSA